MLNEEPAQSQDLQMMGMLLPLGIEKGKDFKPDVATGHLRIFLLLAPSIILRLSGLDFIRIGAEGLHHGVAPAPVAASATIVPVICGCKEQKYS